MIAEVSTFNPTEESTRTFYQLLAGTIAPRPIALASTIDQAGHVNLSPFSFFNVFSSDPPMLIFSPVNRGVDGSAKDTLLNLREVPEVVVNLVDYPMVQQMSLSSGAYARGTNEFVKADFTEEKSTMVKPPRVAEAPVSLECRVDRIISLGDHGGAGNLVLAEVVLLHIKSDHLGDDGMPDPHKLDLVARMGGNWYCHASASALFSVDKPTRKPGIGVDALPERIRSSDVLSGNDLGKLGALTELPSSQTIQKVLNEEVVADLVSGTTNWEGIELLAKDWIALERREEALALFLIPAAL